MDVRNLERHSQSELCRDVTNVASYFVLTITVRTETKNTCLNTITAVVSIAKQATLVLAPSAGEI